MSRRRKAHGEQMSLLDWRPVDPTAGYPADRLKASTLGRAISKSVSETLRRCGRPREAVAEAMSTYLDGVEISKAMLDAYAAESREDLIINLVRLDALLAATKDPMVLETIARRHGWMVIDRKYLNNIALADALERERKASADVDYLRRQVRAGASS